MTKRILVPFDGSPLSERALEHTIENFPTASITTLYRRNRPSASGLDPEGEGRKPR